MAICVVRGVVCCRCKLDLQVYPGIIVHFQCICLLTIVSFLHYLNQNHLYRQSLIQSDPEMLEMLRMQPQSEIFILSKKKQRSPIRLRCSMVTQGSSICTAGAGSRRVATRLRKRGMWIPSCLCCHGSTNSHASGIA